MNQKSQQRAEECFNSSERHICQCNLILYMYIIRVPVNIETLTCSVLWFRSLIV